MSRFLAHSFLHRHAHVDSKLASHDAHASPAWRSAVWIVQLDLLQVQNSGGPSDKSTVLCKCTSVKLLHHLNCFAHRYIFQCSEVVLLPQFPLVPEFLMIQSIRPLNTLLKLLEITSMHRPDKLHRTMAPHRLPYSRIELGSVSNVKIAETTSHDRICMTLRPTETMSTDRLHRLHLTVAPHRLRLCLDVLESD